MERTDPARFEGMATTPRLAPRYARSFAQFAAERGQAFLEEIDAWLHRHELKTDVPKADEPNDDKVGDEAGAQRGVRMGVGVYLIRDETRRGRRK
jgi:hypothetical protein